MIPSRPLAQGPRACSKTFIKAMKLATFDPTSATLAGLRPALDLGRGRRCMLGNEAPRFGVGRVVSLLVGRRPFPSRGARGREHEGKGHPPIHQLQAETDDARAILFPQSGKELHPARKNVAQIICVHCRRGFHLKLL